MQQHISGRQVYNNLVSLFTTAGYSDRDARRYAALAFYRKYNRTPGAYDRSVNAFKEKFSLLSVFDKKPIDAIKFFQSKGILTGVNFAKLSAEAQAKAFTITGVMKVDILQDVKTWIDKSLDEGMAYSEFQKTLTQRFQERGWLAKEEGGEKVVTRLKTIYRNNKQTALMAGRWKQQQAAIAFRPYTQYIPVLDKRTTSTCYKLKGFVAPADDPVWDKITPPNHHGCRSRTRSLSEKDVQRLGVKVQTDAQIPEGVELGEGWDKNPGKEFWKPSPADYDDPALQQHVQAINQQTEQMMEAANQIETPAVPPPAPKPAEIPVQPKAKKASKKITPAVAPPPVAIPAETKPAKKVATPPVTPPPPPVTPPPAAPADAATEDDDFTKEISKEYDKKDVAKAKKKYLSYDRYSWDDDYMVPKEKRLLREEEAGIKFYTSGSYMELNNALRSKKLKPEQAAVTRIINTALKKLPPHKGTVTRGLMIKPEFMKAFLDEHEPGKEIQYTAFTSTTHGTSFGGNVMLHIKNKTGVNIAHMSQAPDEDEVLIPAGARFRVLKVRKVGQETHIEMEEI